MKTPALCFTVNGKHFVNEEFSKTRTRLAKHVSNHNLQGLACSRLLAVGDKQKKASDRGRTQPRKGREGVCKNIFNDPLPPIFGLMRFPKEIFSTCQSTLNDWRHLYICRSLFVLPSYLCFTSVHEGHFMLCYQEEF